MSRVSSGRIHRAEVKRAVTVLLGVVAMIAAVLAVPAGTAAGRSVGPVVPVLRWTACGGGFECTRAAVPLDYDNPAGPAISLALIRLPATDQRHRIGSLLTNPGGPATSGVRQHSGHPQGRVPAGHARPVRHHRL